MVGETVILNKSMIKKRKVTQMTSVKVYNFKSSTVRIK